MDKKQSTCTHCGKLFKARNRTQKFSAYFCSMACKISNDRKHAHLVQCACGCGREKYVSNAIFERNKSFFYDKNCLDAHNASKKYKQAIKPLPAIYSHQHKAAAMGMVSSGRALADYIGLSYYRTTKLIADKDSGFPKPEFTITYRMAKIGYYKKELLDDFKKTIGTLPKPKRKTKEDDAIDPNKPGSLFVKFMGGNPKILEKFGKGTPIADEKNPEIPEQIDTSLGKAWNVKNKALIVDNYFSGAWL